MTTLHVKTKDRDYDILIEKGLFKKAGILARSLSFAEKAAVITDDHVDRLYGNALEESLSAAGFAVKRIAFPAGEESKNLDTLGKVYSELARFGITRSDLIITLGGGVPGDLGGMAAATFLRGVDFIQIPTSLLAQIDSSVGGKVAVDLPEGKNLAGAFYQPLGVFIDPDLLSTLPKRYLHDGAAEAVKYGAIADERLFHFFETLASDEVLLEKSEDIIAACCAIKARIVEHDEFDHGERMKLNFGHTLGHSIEALGGYKTFTHGEGVGMGMLLMTAASEKQGLTVEETQKRIEEALRRLHLPLDSGMELSDLVEEAGRDKKRRGKNITVIIVPSIGKAVLRTIPFDRLFDFMTGRAL